MSSGSFCKSKRLLAAGVSGLFAIALAAGLLMAADADDPILGTWKLNLSKSKYIPGPAPRSQMRVYRQTAEGIFVRIETVGPDGKPRPPIEFPEKYDGKDYPMKGSAIADALALTRINNYLAEAVMKHAGMVVATTRRIITDNGKTLMLIYQETSQEHPVDNIIVYDRQ
jgi:hypothetical protein